MIKTAKNVEIHFHGQLFMSKRKFYVIVGHVLTAKQLLKQMFMDAGCAWEGKTMEAINLV